MKHLLLIPAILLSACSSEEFHEREEVEAVYWHEGNKYSGAFRDGNTITLKRIPINNRYYWNGEMTLVVDERSDTTWYECTWNGSNTNNGTCKIHISSIDALKTGDWNHGKFGSGQTVRVD